MAMPASVPRTSEAAVERIAISSETASAGQRPSSEPIAAYQRSEAPSTGRSNTGVGEKLAAAITMSGARRKTATPIIADCASMRANAPLMPSLRRATARTGRRSRRR